MMLSWLVMVFILAGISTASDPADDTKGNTDPLSRDQFLEMYREIQSTKFQLNEALQSLSKVKKQVESLSKIKEEVKSLSKAKNIHEEAIGNLQRSATTTVAFSAMYYNDQAERDPYIVFDTVTLNIGHGYNASSGMFTAPVRGVYFFATNLQKVLNTYTIVQVTKNGQEISATESFEDVDLDTLVSTVITELNKGDEVAVWLKDGNVYTSNFGQTTFMGTLLSVIVE